MNLFSKSTFCLVDKEYWQDLDKEFFLPPRQLINQLQLAYKYVGRRQQYRHKQPYQYPKFYNYQSLIAFGCICDSYISSLKLSKRSRLIYKNLILSIFIKTKVHHQGCSEALINYYKKFYNHYKHNDTQLMFQKQFLNTLQQLMESNQEQITQLDEMIKKYMNDLEQTILSNQKLEIYFEQELLPKQSILQKQLIKQLNDLFLCKIVSMVLCEQQYGFLEQYPHNKKIGVFNFYKVKFQPDYNKFQIIIQAQFIEKVFTKNKLKNLTKTKNLENGKYCHICKQITEDPLLFCKRRIPLPVPKNNANTVQCGKAYCENCYRSRQARLNLEKKQDSQTESKLDQNMQVCLSCSGECQCEICLRDELIGGLYRSMVLQHGSLQKTIPNYYLFYRQRIK